MSRDDIFDSRMVKLDYVSEVTNPYPERFEKTHEISEAYNLSDGIQTLKLLEE